MLSTRSQVIIIIIAAVVVILVVILFIGALCFRCVILFKKSHNLNLRHPIGAGHNPPPINKPAAPVSPVMYEEIDLSSADSPSRQKIDLRENDAYGISWTMHNLPPINTPATAVLPVIYEDINLTSAADPL